MTVLMSDWFGLAIASAIVFGLAGLMMKASHAQQGSTPHLLFGLYCMGTLLFTAHSAIAGHVSWSSMSWLLLLGGILVGSGSAWGNDLFMRALNAGPASLTSPITNMNIIFVILFSTWWYQEPLRVWQWISIGILVLSVFLLSYKPNRSVLEQTHLPAKWFLLVFAAMLLFALRNGGLKVTQSWDLHNDTVLAIAYGWSLAWFSPPVIRLWKKRERNSGNSIGLLWGFASGICSYGGMQLYAYALERGQANVVSPIFATNSMIIAIGSMIWFGERLRGLQWVALLFIFAGLILIRWN